MFCLVEYHIASKLGQNAGFLPEKKAVQRLPCCHNYGCHFSGGFGIAFIAVELIQELIFVN